MNITTPEKGIHNGNKFENNCMRNRRRDWGVQATKEKMWWGDVGTDSKCLNTSYLRM